MRRLLGAQSRAISEIGRSTNSATMTARRLAGIGTNRANRNLSAVAFAESLASILSLLFCCGRFGGCLNLSLNILEQDHRAFFWFILNLYNRSLLIFSLWRRVG